MDVCLNYHSVVSLIGVDGSAGWTWSGGADQEGLCGVLFLICDTIVTD